MDAVPTLVSQAEALAQEDKFPGSCTREIGALLRTLSARTRGRVLELGTGCGVGTAWLASEVGAAGELITIDRDSSRHDRVAALFGGHSNVNVLFGEWRTALDRGPFDLIFVDIGEAKDGGCDEVVAGTSVGGMLVLDDFTPGPLYEGEHDSRWHRWIHHPRLAACEVMVSTTSAVILATRIL